MRQTDVIFAGIGIAFLIYITVRGQLGQYAALLIGTPGQSTATASSAASSGSGSSTSGGSPGASTITAFAMNALPDIAAAGF